MHKGGPIGFPLGCSGERLGEGQSHVWVSGVNPLPCIQVGCRQRDQSWEQPKGWGFGQVSGALLRHLLGKCQTAPRTS